MIFSGYWPRSLPMNNSTPSLCQAQQLFIHIVATTALHMRTDNDMLCKATEPFNDFKGIHI